MSLFINPSALPGGRDWSASCAAAAAVAAAGNRTTATVLTDRLGCGESTTGGLVQVLLLLCTYGYILFTASSLISNGSELLLLVPSLKDVVGSIVLPVLGAIPDGCIVFFSGLGPNAQEEISVGVGALAGSTCMLLTIPWFLAVFAGRVNILPGEAANYRRYCVVVGTDSHSQNIKRIHEASFAYYDVHGDYRISTSEFSQLMIDLCHRLPGDKLARLRPKMAKQGKNLNRAGGFCAWFGDVHSRE
jgi:hypothetical protein